MGASKTITISNSTLTLLLTRGGLIQPPLSGNCILPIILLIEPPLLVFDFTNESHTDVLRYFWVICPKGFVGSAPQSQKTQFWPKSKKAASSHRVNQTKSSENKKVQTQWVTHGIFQIFDVGPKPEALQPKNLIFGVSALQVRWRQRWLSPPPLPVSSKYFWYFSYSNLI